MPETQKPEDAAPTEDLKPAIEWSPDLHATAENWPELHEQGWKWDSNAPLGPSDRRIWMVRQFGLQNVIDGEPFDKITKIPTSVQPEGSAAERGLYYRASVASIAYIASLGSINKGEKFVPMNERSRYVENPYDAQRLNEAVEAGVFDRAISDYDIVREAERLAEEKFM